MSRPITDQAISSVPIAVLDVETTGLVAGADRIVEISVVRVFAGRTELVLDTLVNPERRVTGTEVHGITDFDVVDAPTFSQVGHDLARSLAGSLVAGYNVYFDIRFIHDELGRAGIRCALPHMCLMYLRPMLGLGKKCCLADACLAHGIEHEGFHTASSDALASARLWNLYLDAIADRGIRTFKELGSLKTYKFVDSFELVPLDEFPARSPARQKSRRTGIGGVPGTHAASRVHRYWDAVLAAIGDMDLTDPEVEELRRLSESLSIAPEEVRAVHGRIFAGLLGEVLSDQRVTEEEWQRLRRMHYWLGRLGWAPGV